MKARDDFSASITYPLPAVAGVRASKREGLDGSKMNRVRCVHRVCWWLGGFTCMRRRGGGE